LAFHHDLLEQAGHLVSRERKKPKQASLRRAVSAAYYSLFHLLVAEGARLLSPRQPPGLRVLIQRAFNHGDMRDVCRGFIQGSVAASLNRDSNAIPPATRLLLTLPLEPALVTVLEAFVELQEVRHQADYDLRRTWNRLDAATHVSTARNAFASWQTVRLTPNAAVFAAALLLQKQWGR
jgi:uncharacterized protein (UPF0332 family)